MGRPAAVPRNWVYELTLTWSVVITLTGKICGITPRMKFNKLEMTILTILITLWIGQIGWKCSNNHWVCSTFDHITIYSVVSNSSWVVQCSITTWVLMQLWLVERHFTRGIIFGYFAGIGQWNSDKIESVACEWQAQEHVASFLRGKIPFTNRSKHCSSQYLMTVAAGRLGFYTGLEKWLYIFRPWLSFCCILGHVAGTCLYIHNINIWTIVLQHETVMWIHSRVVSLGC